MSQIDRKARQTLSKHGFTKKNGQYKHTLGHGIGLEIHEKPSIGTDSNEKIQNNMVFTIEPAVYLEGKFGIRIEDTVMVKNGEVEILSKSSKKMNIRNL